ncbi:MAG TPA: dihydroorotate dehydrogenase [Candidatus Methanoperedenaceae archaeon]|nr:dihydroorotate dehydrogenase [Candidatus Methanoperedenaceae archaeon]
MSRDITIELTGLHLGNPVLLAAGILGSTGASLKRAAASGAGAVVTKSIGTVPKPGHPNPTMAETACGFLNALGLPNPSYREFADELRVAKEGGVPVIASIFGADAREFREVAEGLAGADAYELNLSCPHAEGYGAMVGTDPGLVEELTAAVKDCTRAPVWAKLTPNVTNITGIGLAAQRGGADAVVAINTVRGMAIDIESGYPVLGNKFGGLSGPSIKPIAIKAVYDLYEALDIPVIGVGGISSWQDAVEMIMAGAASVQIGTAAGRDPEIFRKVASGIISYLDSNRWELSDIRGLAHEVTYASD